MLVSFLIVKWTAFFCSISRPVNWSMFIVAIIVLCCR